MTPFLDSIDTIETRREDLGKNGVQVVYVKTIKEKEAIEINFL